MVSTEYMRRSCKIRALFYFELKTPSLRKIFTDEKSSTGDDERNHPVFCHETKDYLPRQENNKT